MKDRILINCNLKVVITKGTQAQVKADIKKDMYKILSSHSGGMQYDVNGIDNLKVVDKDYSKGINKTIDRLKRGVCKCSEGNGYREVCIRCSALHSIHPELVSEIARYVLTGRK